VKYGEGFCEHLVAIERALEEGRNYEKQDEWKPPVQKLSVIEPEDEPPSRSDPMRDFLSAYRGGRVLLEP
jgi:hypothetical protein